MIIMKYNFHRKPLDSTVILYIGCMYINNNKTCFGDRRRFFFQLSSQYEEIRLPFIRISL